MDTKVKGLILKTTDIKDADKLASIFAFDEGVITCKFTGVKKDKAKFKAIAQPFSFCDFVVNVTGKTKTIISADLLDNFYEIMSNYNKTICGYILLDILSSILPKEKQENELLLLSITSLKNIEQKNEYISLIDFILKFISFQGMEIEFPKIDYPYLDLTSAEFVSSHLPNSIQIDKKIYNILTKINANQTIDTTEFNDNTLKQAIRLLHNILYIKFNEDVKAFQFI